MQGVLYKDASIASHPIVRPVYHPSHITENFDSISYHKVSIGSGLFLKNLSQGLV